MLQPFTKKIFRTNPGGQKLGRVIPNHGRQRRQRRVREAEPAVLFHFDAVHHANGNKKAAAHGRQVAQAD